MTALHWAGSFRRAVQKQAQTPRENGEAGSREGCVIYVTWRVKGAEAGLSGVLAALLVAVWLCC